MRPSANILIIDDSEFDRDLVKNLISRAIQARFLQASSADEGLKIAEKTLDLDLILLDLSMPGKSGEEFLKEFRGDRRREDVSVIVISGHGEDETIARCLKSGANDFIIKPIGAVVALSRIQNQLKLAKNSRNEKIALGKEVESNKKLRLAYEALDVATRSIRAILSSIQQGICILDCDLKFSDEYSHFMTQLAEQEVLKNCSFSETILRKSSLSRDQIEIIHVVIAGSIGEKREFSFDVNLENLPREFKLAQSSGKLLILEADWIPLIDSSSIVTSVMCTLRDITILRELRERTKTHEEELQMIDEILHLKPDQWAYFENCKAQLLKRYSKLSLAHCLHKMKGMSRLLGLTLVSSQIHAAESELAHQVDDSAVFEDKIQTPLIGFLARYETLIRGKIQPIVQLQMPVWSEGESGNNFIPIEQILPELQTLLKTSAATLNRRVPVLELDSDKIELTTQLKLELLPLFSLLLINSVDHGFSESTQDPRVFLKIFAQGNEVLMDYGDNGRGLDLNKLKGNRSTGSTDWSQIAASIFLPGVSTRSEVSEFSGRGIGMSSVRQSIESWGGSVRVAINEPPESLEQCPFTIKITLPSSAGIRRQNKKG